MKKLFNLRVLVVIFLLSFVVGIFLKFFLESAVNYLVIKSLQRSYLANLVAVATETLLEWKRRGGFTQDLKVGDAGSEVKLLQMVLAEDPEVYPEKYITGFFGYLTKSALERLKLKLELPPEETGYFGPLTRKKINELLFDQLCPQNPPSYIDLDLYPLSKKEKIPPNYVPQNLIDISSEIRTVGKICLKKEVVPFLKKMFEEAEREGIYLKVTSGFRTIKLQNFLFNYWVNMEGVKAFAEVAPGGSSEHHLGTTIDLTGLSINYRSVSPEFGETPEGIWLQKNAHRYGFIMSYPKEKEKITGYNYEPWHFRFVGTKIAQELKEKGLTLNEYLARSE